MFLRNVFIVYYEKSLEKQKTVSMQADYNWYDL